eukprot:5337389-Pyramimonas_sp.AAC.1
MGARPAALQGRRLEAGSICAASTAASQSGGSFATTCVECYGWFLPGLELRRPRISFDGC